VPAAVLSGFVVAMVMIAPLVALRTSDALTLIIVVMAVEVQDSKPGSISYYEFILISTSSPAPNW